MTEQVDTIPEQTGWTVVKGDFAADFGRSNQHAATEFLRMLENPQTKLTFKGELL